MIRKPQQPFSRSNLICSVRVNHYRFHLVIMTLSPEPSIIVIIINSHTGSNRRIFTATPNAHIIIGSLAIWSLAEPTRSTNADKHTCEENVRANERILEHYHADDFLTRQIICGTLATADFAQTNVARIRKTHLFGLETGRWRLIGRIGFRNISERFLREDSRPADPQTVAFDHHRTYGRHQTARTVNKMIRKLGKTFIACENPTTLTSHCVSVYWFLRHASARMASDWPLQ